MTKNKFQKSDFKFDLSNQIINLLLNANSGFSNDEMDWANLIKLLRFHGLIPFVAQYGKLDNRDIPHIHREKLHHQAKYLTAENLRKSAVQAQLQKILTQHNIPFLFIKGLHLSLLLYGTKTLRPLLDIDILLKEEDEDQVRQLLIQLGGKETKHLQNRFIQNLGNHKAPLLYNDTLIELHTHIASGESKINFESTDIWHQIKTYKYDSYEFMAFNEPFYLLFLCMHAHRHFTSGKIKLLWYIDITIFIKKSDNQTALVRETLALAKKSQTEHAIQSTLYLVSKFLLLPLPFLDFNDLSSPGNLNTRFLQLIGQSSFDVQPNYYSRTFQNLSFVSKIKYGISLLFPSIQYIKSRFQIQSASIALLYLLVNPFRVIGKVLFVLIKRGVNGEK